MDAILFEQLSEGLDPDVSVLSTFTHPDGDVPLVAKVDVFLDVLLSGVDPIFVEGINQVVGEGLSKPVELRSPHSTIQDDDMIWIHRPDGCCNTFIQGL